MDMSADRTSATRANQLRLWPSSKAHILGCALLRIGLKHTHCKGFLRLHRLALLKVGAVVSISACRAKIAMASRRPCLETPWHILNNSAPLRNPG